MMELGAGTRLFTCWLPTSPVTCQRVTESIFCTVTVRGHWRETVLKQGFFEKCGDGRPSFFARNSGSGDLLHEMRDWKGIASSLWWFCMGAKKTHSFLISPRFWFLSAAEQNTVLLGFSLPLCILTAWKVTKTVFVLSFKEAHYQLTCWFSACFPSNLLFQIIFFFSLVWLGSIGKQNGQRPISHQLAVEAVCSSGKRVEVTCYRNWKLLPSFKGKNYREIKK